MGVDLKWLILDSYFPARGWGYSHSMMELGRDYAYHQKLRELPDEAIPNDFSSYVAVHPSDGDSCYGQTTQTPYGEDLRMVKVSDILSVEHDFDGQYWAEAALAYIRCLPPDTRVALYWH